MAAKVGGQAAVLRGDLGFGSADGWTTVWALTPEGFEIGSQRLGLKLERVPKHDVGQAFLKHEVMVNEVLLGLVPQDGKTPAKVPQLFRWILGEYLNLPFEEFDRTALRLEKRRLQPDAMLEDPAHQRRYFIEYETGSATIHDAKKSTSTRAKLDRYVAFFTGNYRTHFLDGWRPRLLFVTQSEARRNSIAELLEKEDFPTIGEFAGRALTLDEAKQYLSRKLSSAASSPASERPASASLPAAAVRPQAAPRPANWVEAAPFRPPPPPRPGLETGPALCEAEERLRRGRVSVRGEQLVRLETEMEKVLYVLQRTQEALAKHVRRDAIPSLPEGAISVLRVFSAYARRAESALARYDLKAAD